MRITECTVVGDAFLRHLLFELPEMKGEFLVSVSSIIRVHFGKLAQEGIEFLRRSTFLHGALHFLFGLFPFLIKDVSLVGDGGQVSFEHFVFLSSRPRAWLRNPISVPFCVVCCRVVCCQRAGSSSLRLRVSVTAAIAASAVLSSCCTLVVTCGGSCG